MTAVDAIVLAGGRASRMGGVDKPAIVIGGRSMLDAALAAVRLCARTVVVGPHRSGLDPRIVQVREVPPGSGPVAAVGAGLRALGPTAAPLVVVLAADLPFLSESTLTELIRYGNESGADAVFAADESGRPQYLIGVWRRAALAAALGRLDSLINQPMKALIPADTVTVTMAGIADCDTEEQVRRARLAWDTGVAELGGSSTRPAPPPTAATTALPLDEARDILRTSLSRLTDYRAELRSVRGATLAAPLTAVAPLPRFDVSAMDGYAVAGAGPWRLRRDIGFAGGRRPVGLLPGEAVRIATGAHVPDGTTRVLRDEFARIEPDDTLHQRPDSPLRDDIRRHGEDRDRGDLVAPEGTAVTAALVSAAASVEITEALVRGPVRARIIMTGDEIRSTGPLQTGQTRDSIGPILPDVLSWCGIRAVDQVHLRDTPRGFDEVLGAADDCDLLVIVGATGGGAADQLRAAIARAEARILVHRLAVRPGGSTVVAELANGTTILGLPGNPFAALATLMTLSPALVEGRTGGHPQRPLVGPLHNASAISGPVTRIVPARIAPYGGWLGDPQVRTTHLGGLVDRDGLVIVAAEATDDDLVEFLPLRV
ncbi:NTP transferase domain-containing protein [Nocardia sp. NBC_00565]|uniref:NTP transferase domain-containing protein n=1 Tax=Nocardia sp. NBC_00565 TaxID=2975993 RepID=UPI002E81F731|nr:NTP transferase domain-containing protein [Nocardia sp. NBC_00565]WUC00503.1 NTP transferase domain-containing protein [Nocardia sp. NBC_00565]